MGIKIVGLLWGLIMLFYISKGKKAFLELVFVSLLFQCDNFIVLGSVGVGLHLVTIAVGLFVFLPINHSCVRARKQNLTVNTFISTFILLFFIIFLSWIKNRIKFDFVQICILLVYFGFLLELMYTKDSLKSVDIDSIVMRTLKIVTIIGTLQVLEKSGFTMLDIILKPLVYNDTDNLTVCYNNKPINSFYSSFMEPSYCGAYLVACFGYLSLKKIESSKDIVWLILVGIEILLTRSSTAYLGLAVTLLLVCFNGKNKSVFKKAFPIIALGIIAFLVIQLDSSNQLLNDVIFEKSQSASYKVRSYWNNKAIENYRTSPMIGIGYKQSRASSFVLTMLAETGIMGFSCLVVQFIILIVNRFFNEQNRIKQTSMFLISMLICQSIAVPDLIFSPLWFGFYIFILSMVHVYDKGEENENRNTNI